MNVFFSWIAEQRKNVDRLNAELSPENKLTLYFRGVNNHNFDNIPSIYRNRGLRENESALYKDCMTSCPRDFDGEKTTFDRLVKMQHYGAPTRLLDISSNPLVALFFASENVDTIPGKVYAIYVSEKARKFPDSDTVAAVSNLALQSYDFNITHADEKFDDFFNFLEKYPDALDIGRKEKEIIQIFNTGGEMGYLHHEIKAEKPHFQEIIKREHLESIWCIKAKLNNNRIARQDGQFLLYGILGDKSIPLTIPNIDVAEKILDFMKSYKIALNNTAKNHNHCLCCDKIDNKTIDKFKEIMKFICLPDDVIVKYGDILTQHPVIEGTATWSCLNDVLKKIRAQALIEKHKIINHMLLISNRTRYSPYSSPSNLEAEMQICTQKVITLNLFLGIIDAKNMIFCDAVKIINKSDIIKELSGLGVTRDKLFPELESVADFMKKKYASAK